MSFQVNLHFTRQILHFSKKGCTSFIKFLKPLYLSIFQQFQMCIRDRKEGVTEKSKFEVLEAELSKEGKMTYKRVGVIQPKENLIWDNRYMASEEQAYGSDFGFTTFRKVSGGDFYPGMLIREIK